MDGGNFHFFLLKETDENYCFLQYWVMWGFFALKLILPLKISLSTSSCTEFILPAMTYLLGIFALSPFLPWCLTSLYILFWLLSCFSTLLQITMCEREHALSCSVHMHTPPSSNQVLHWLGLRCRAGISETFWSFHIFHVLVLLLYFFFLFLSSL